MKEIYSNINIVGGGLIGTITAFSLSNLGYKITILEKNPPFKKKNYLDMRTTAISEGTKKFLDSIGFWKDISKFSQPINMIKVLDRKLTNKLSFDNLRRKSNLGYIIENKHILDKIYFKLKEKKNVKILNNFKLTDLYTSKDKTIINSDKIKIISDLNIAADGKNSFVKKILKTPHYFKDYKKSAFVLTFTHSKNHNNTAYEFFYENGPLAILPMKKNKDKFLSSIVWTNKNHFLNSLLSMSDVYIKKILDQNTHNCLGNIKEIITKQQFPLSAHLNSRLYEQKTIYVGDSAHSFHPIAGQGWNLGMKSVENLYNLTKKYKTLGIDLGSNEFCKNYHNDNFYNALALYQITDKLDHIFKIQNPFLYFARSTTLKLINKNILLKNKISDYAMGIN